MQQLYLASAGMKEALLGAASRAPLAYAAEKAAEYYGTHARHGFTGKEIGDALSVLMTGPKATRPTWRALRKTIQRMRRGMDVSKGGWRRWPHEGEPHYAF